MINTILGASKKTHGTQRVAVSSTPGKTKHFQTLAVSDSVMICDCPGLVFPSFMQSTAEMVCSGILPINQMRDCDGPASVIASRVPSSLLEATYGIKIIKSIDFKDNPLRPPTGTEMLSAYCAVKGYITSGTGRWDEFRACKEMLRDFTDGKILFVAEPPKGTTQDPIDSARWLSDSEKTMMKTERTAERLAVIKLKEIEASYGDVTTQFSCGGGNDDDDDGEFVFGDANADYSVVDSDGGGQIYSSSGADADLGLDPSADDQDGNGNPGKREHKRLKHWGKKNKKLRDKNPYGEENGVLSYIAYSTNRPLASSNLPINVKPKRNDPKLAYGTPYTRPTMPYNSSAVHNTSRHETSSSSSQQQLVDPLNKRGFIKAATNINNDPQTPEI